ncbi:helix-turn-helix transcriptional regulator [Saccharospirillum sp. HFRX-1]|uniref:AraC family transcriptional regulator n=1 Tax=unclassified Saccharospirillum TaxID=2633430 RepID=UPI00371CE47C
MPFIESFEQKDALQSPDDIDGSVVFGTRLLQPIVSFELEPHRHERGQLLFALQGALTCDVEDGLWLVPAHTALWLPPQALHSIKASGPLEGYNVFLESKLTTELPSHPCTLAITSLVREVVARLAHFPVPYPRQGAAARLLAVLKDEISSATIEQLNLPMPRDPRLQPLVSQLLEHPDDHSPIKVWAQRLNLSERSLARIIKADTGLSFGRWRQQWMVMIALRQLSCGASVKQVALELGYESAGNFITMFRKLLGCSPSRYMARQGQAVIG